MSARDRFRTSPEQRELLSRCTMIKLASLLMIIVLCDGGLCSCSADTSDRAFAIEVAPREQSLQRVLSVHGPFMAGMTDARLRVIYSTGLDWTEALMQPQCEVSINRLEGAYEPRRLTTFIRMSHRGGENVGNVVIDRYAPGRCRWGLN